MKNFSGILRSSLLMNMILHLAPTLDSRHPNRIAKEKKIQGDLHFRACGVARHLTPHLGAEKHAQPTRGSQTGSPSCISSARPSTIGQEFMFPLLWERSWISGLNARSSQQVLVWVCSGALGVRQLTKARTIYGIDSALLNRKAGMPRRFRDEDAF